MDATCVYNEIRELVRDREDWHVVKVPRSWRKRYYRTKSIVLGGYKVRFHYHTDFYIGSKLQMLHEAFNRELDAGEQVFSNVVSISIYNGPKSSYCIACLGLDSHGTVHWSKELDEVTWMKIRLAG